MSAHTGRAVPVGAGGAPASAADVRNGAPRARGKAGDGRKSRRSNSGRTGTTATPPRILLVDDDALSREVGARTVALLGHAADTANSGPEALRMIEQRAYEVVMLDYHMPGMDGYETAARIRDLECRLARSPAHVVAVTAAAVVRPAVDPRALAFDDFLWKPFRLEALKDLIERWLA